MPAKTSVTMALTKYFNKDENGKSIKSLGDWNAELKTLSPNEKRELAELVAVELDLVLV